MNIAKNVERSALFFPEYPIISEKSREISYSQFNKKTNRIANALTQMGIKPGDHVGLCAPNSGEWLAFYFGILKAGAVAVTLSSLLQADEMKLLVNHSKPKILLTHDDKIEDLESLRPAGFLEKIICESGDISFQQLEEMGSEDFKTIERDPDDNAAILYTGGTTGTPKGVMLTHENITMAIQNVVFHERSSEKDRALLFLPFNHVFGQMHIMNATILSAGCLEMLPAFDLDEVLKVLDKGLVTKLFAVPTIYVRLLEVEGIKQKLKAVRYCFSAAASMAAEIVYKWKETTGLSIHESYGMTEAAPMVTYNHYYQHVIGSVGTHVSGVEIQIRDEKGKTLEQGKKGEICIRGRNIMKGYLDNPEATRAAFWEGRWFRSGDVGVMDEKGYLFIVDRLKDMIITGGENVYSQEVEDVLYKYPSIQECAVIGIPDKEWGERVIACIIKKTDVSFDEKELNLFMKENLSRFKVPKEYHLMDDFPRSPAGKILKRKLREEILE
jgi:long-chain acyl-CoA synthetase